MVSVLLVIAAAQSPPQASTPAKDPSTHGLVVSLFPYPYPGHVEMFPDIDAAGMSPSSKSYQHSFLEDNTLITKLESDYDRDKIYYIDVYRNSIMCWKNVSRTLKAEAITTINETITLYEGLSRAIGSLEIGVGHLYWSDPLLHHIAMIPFDSDNHADVKVLLTDDMAYVAAMAIDVESKFLFWVSSSHEDAKMERSNLYGEDRTVLLNTSIGFIDDMTSDMKEKRLYWVDSYRRTVETAAYDGSKRRIIRRLIAHEYTSIAVMENNICLVNHDSFEMQCMYKNSGDRYAYHSFYPSNPYAVTFFHPDIQKTDLENKCNTTACAHICFNTNTDPKCLCWDGYKLDSNGKTCTQTNPLFENAIVMINGTHICMIQVPALLSSKENKPIRCEATNATNDTTLIQSDVAKNLLYYTAKGQDAVSNNKTQLLQFDLGSGRHRVVLPDMEDPADMVFDWVDNKMYSCHTRYSLIKSWDVVTARSSNIYTGISVTKVYKLAIDPHRTNLFWIADTVDGLGIYRGTFTGATPDKLVSRGSLKLPSGLIFDDLEDSVCFLDAGRFFSVNSNGSVIDHRLSTGDANQMVIYKDYLVWKAGPATLKTSLYVMDSSTYTTTTGMGTIHSMTLFAKEAQKAFLDPCKIGNGGCDDLCFRKNQTVLCACDFGRTLQSNGKSCKAVPLTTDFLLVTDLSHDRILQVSMDGKTIISLPFIDLLTPAMARYSPIDDKVYWSDVGSRSLRMGNTDGTNNQKIFSVGGDEYIDRFCFDFTTQHLFYTVAHTKEMGKSYIAVINPKADQTQSKTLIKYQDYIGGIAIDPLRGYIYFNNQGVDVFIARAEGDGTNIKKIVTFAQGGSPLGMAIDYQNKLLYWADAYTDQDKIEYIDLEGTSSSRGVLKRDMTSDSVDLALSDGFLYYVGYNRHRIMKVDVANKKFVNFMEDQPDFGACDSVDIVPTTNTQPVNTQCGSNKGMCSHYCFSTPSGKKCGCPDGLYLDQTSQRNCTTVPPKCPIIIPNGKLNPGCSALRGTSCGYSCTENNYIKNPLVSIINCTSSLFWDSPTDTLCLEKVCQTNMKIGSLVDCQGKSGEACSWTCPTPLVKKPQIEAVFCLSNGKWSTDLNTLCLPMVKCTTGIPNGNLQSCTYAADKSCKVRCNINYSPVVDFIHCLPDGLWDKELANICEVTKEVTPEKQMQATSTAGLTAAVAVVVTLLVVLICLGVAFYICRRRVFSADKQNVQGSYRASPNVYFNASDSRNQAATPPQGFSNPTMASNGEAMPNTNPLKLDQINLSNDTTNQNLQNEGHYDSITDGRPVTAGHEAVNPLYSTMQHQEELAYTNAEDVSEKPGYHKFN